MVNSNNQDPFYKKTIQNLHWNIVFTFSLVAFTAVLSERLGSTDGAELSDNHINSNQNRNEFSSSAMKIDSDEYSVDAFEPVQPMNFDDPFDPINPNSINNPFNPLNPNNINSPLNPLNPLNQTDPTSPYYHGDDLLDLSNPLNCNNPASPFCQDDSSIDLFSDSSSQALFSGGSFGDSLGSSFDDSFSSGLGSGFDDHF